MSFTLFSVFLKYFMHPDSSPDMSQLPSCVHCIARMGASCAVMDVSYANVVPTWQQRQRPVRARGQGWRRGTPLLGGSPFHSIKSPRLEPAIRCRPSCVHTTAFTEARALEAPDASSAVV